MEIIGLLLPIALLVAGSFLVSYLWAVRSGQFDDTTTPAYRILIEDEDRGPQTARSEKNDDKEGAPRGTSQDRF